MRTNSSLCHVIWDLRFHFSENGVLDGEEAVAVAKRGERMVGEEAASHLREKRRQTKKLQLNETDKRHEELFAPPRSER